MKRSDADYIEIIERVGFRHGKAISWKKSFDGGLTWQIVEWPGGELPFALVNPDGNDAEIVQKIWVPD